MPVTPSAPMTLRTIVMTCPGSVMRPGRDMTRIVTKPTSCVIRLQGTSDTCQSTLLSVYFQSGPQLADCSKISDAPSNSAADEIRPACQHTNQGGWPKRLTLHACTWWLQEASRAGSQVPGHIKGHRFWDTLFWPDEA